MAEVDERVSPRTEAGKRRVSPPCTCGFIASYDYDHSLTCGSRRGVPLTDILAIEDEAIATREAELREAVRRDLPHFESCILERQLTHDEGERLLDGESFNCDCPRAAVLALIEGEKGADQ